MPGQYSSVTVVAPGITRDMALPAHVPVAELLPPLLDRGLGEHGSAAGTGPADALGLESRWELATVAGVRLHPSRSLAESQINDGDILHLQDITDQVLPDPVEDVRDSVEDHVDGNGSRWKANTGRTYATIVAAVAVVAASLVSGDDLAILLTGGLVCAMAIVVAWWSAPQSPLLARLALAGGVLWAWRLTYLATEGLGDAAGATGGLLRHTYGLWAAVLLMLVSLIGTPLALPYLIGLAAAAIATTAVSVAMLLGAEFAATIAVAGIAVIFAIGLLPRAAMGTSGLLGLDRDIQTGSTARETELQIILGRVDAMLIGAISAMAALGTMAAAALTLQGGLWTALLGLGMGLALLTRSRIFDQARHVAPMRVAGTVAIVAAGWVWVSGNALRPWLPALVVLAALAYVGLASIPRSTVANATAARILRFGEILLVAALMAMAAQVAGLYAAIGW